MAILANIKKGQTEMRYLFAIITALVVTGALRADDNIVVVFDTSGSMGERMRGINKTRMIVAKEALTGVLANVPSGTKVGLLTFEGWQYDLAPVDKDKMTEAIQKCGPGGGTPLYEFIRRGADRLLTERQKQGNVGLYKLVVVTDGEAGDSIMNNDGKFSNGNFKPGVLKDIMSRGIIVDAIGLEMKTDHSLKTQINGAYMKGDNPESITSSLKKAVAEIGSGKDGAISEEAFKEIAELPEGFVKASIEGLTEYRNYPVGSEPPVMVVMNGVATPVAVAGSGMYPVLWFVIIATVLVVVVGFIVICRNSCG